MDYRIAILDIENFPIKGYAWEAMQKYPDRRNLIAVDQPGCIASFAFKWEGDNGDPKCYSLPDFKKTYANNPFDDSKLTERMYDVLEEAHLVTGHNIDQFDVRKMNASMLIKHITPPAPRKSFDTLTEIRKHFYLPSYKLDYIAEILGCPFRKLEHEGIGLWLKCWAGDMEAWARFIEYNKQDVRISQWVYHRVRAWSRSHPNITLLGDKDNLCPVCGYKTRHLKGSPGLLKSFAIERYRCLRKSCGKTSFGQRSKLNIKVLSS
jgi:hypothetical protein